MNTTEIFSLPERRLQHIVRLLLSDTNAIRHTTAGKPLQVVSPGEWNVAGGPDFRNMAVLVDGSVTIGDGEFHRRTSDWTAHAHDSNPAYEHLLLHIVLEDDTGRAFARHTLVVDACELAGLLHTVPEPAGDTGSIPVEELQEYAYRRLLRKTAEATDLVRIGSTASAFVLLARRYAEKRSHSKQRPGAKNATRAIDESALLQSEPALLLAALAADGKAVSVYRAMAHIVQTKWIDTGVALRMELLVNAFLPVALATANDTRSDLLTWYWSQRAAQRYGALGRRYPAVGQEYIWKQQGLLEYAALHKFGPDRVAESDARRKAYLCETEQRLALPKVRIVIQLESGEPGHASCK